MSSVRRGRLKATMKNEAAVSLGKQSANARRKKLGKKKFRESMKALNEHKLAMRKDVFRVADYPQDDF